MQRQELQSTMSLAGVDLAGAIDRVQRPSRCVAAWQAFVAIAGQFDRSRRVMLLLAAVWVLNAFDLCFTIIESNGRFFRELNPMAAQLLDTPVALATYKVSLVFMGSFILLKHRRRRISELGCWFLLCTYSYLWVRWAEYYDHLTVTLNDPCVVTPLSSALP